MMMAALFTSWLHRRVILGTVEVPFDQSISERPTDLPVNFLFKRFNSSSHVMPMETLRAKSHIGMSQGKVDQTNIERFARNYWFSKMNNIVTLGVHFSTTKMNTEASLHWIWERTRFVSPECCCRLALECGRRILDGLSLVTSLLNLNVPVGREPREFSPSV